MRGINQKKHKAAHAEGTLSLLPRPMAYKGTAHAWLRNLKGLDEKASWIDEPPLPDGPMVPKVPLSSIGCPACGHQQGTVQHELRGKLGFHQLTCQRCRQVTSTRMWRCACRILWFKCERQVPRRLIMKGTDEVASSSTGLKRKATNIYGMDKPMPKRRALNTGTCEFSSSNAPTRISLRPGSKLALKFPHLVQQ